jgi:hypothetical protein
MIETGRIRNRKDGLKENIERPSPLPWLMLRRLATT